MSFGGFGSSSSAPASSGFGGFGSGTSSGFGSSAAASPFGGGGGATGAFGAGTSTFGAGAAKPAFGGFGATPAATGGFGAPQTTTTTGFGGFGTAAPPATGFGAAANPTTTSGFGPTSAFGGGASTGGFGSSVTSAFGSSTPFGAKPAASSSPFGSTNAFGTGAGTASAFGGGATAGGFGTPTPASGGMFGSTPSSGFGAASTAKSPFGAPSTSAPGGFGTQPTGQTGFSTFGPQAGATASPMGQVQVGTGQPPYQSTREMEPSGTGGTANYISISRMQAYAHKSAEELRYEDYLKRTNPAAAHAAAIQNAPAPGTTTPSGGPSAFGVFGAPSAKSAAFGTTGGFGSSQPSAFGGASTSGGFGSSAFGATAPAAGGFGGFGSQATAPTASGNLFGNSTATQSTSAFGAPTTNNVFGVTPSAFGAPATSGGGFGSTTGGFGATFGAIPAAPSQTGGFGSFGAPTSAVSSSFNASGFGKPAASSGFGSFGATTAPTAAQATGSFGFGATQPQTGATSSFFGGSGTATPASTGFSFGTNVAKPGISGGTGFGSLGSSSTFGGTSGSAFGATATPSAFGATPVPSASGTTSLFGSTNAAAGPSGGFSFGSAPAAASGSTNSLFGASKPPTTSLFGSTTANANSGSLFGGNTGSSGSSFFGAPATNTGTTGFGFGTGGGFGSMPASSFGGFGATATPSAPTGGFGTTSNLFGLPQQAQVAAAVPQTLVAAPDVNPYGSGSFGAGLVEQNVKSALDLQTLKTGARASSRSVTFADDIGLSRDPMGHSLGTRRQTISNRHAIPISFIRGSFKGTRSRFPTFTISTALPSGSEVDRRAKEDEFKFTSSLFRNSVTKKLVIDKGKPLSAPASSKSPHVSVVPITDGDCVSVYELDSARKPLLKTGDDGKYAVSFCNQTNKKLFSLRLHPKQAIKQTRSEVKVLLEESSLSKSSSIEDVELILKGKILRDNSSIEDLQLREGDSIDVAVIETVTDEKKRDNPSIVHSKVSEAPLNDESAPPKRFMSYDEYLASAGREEDDLFKDTEKIGAAGDASSALSSCPKLTNRDYYTIPSYERLQAMSDQELSQVDKLTVGCRGLGAVEWLGTTDVRNLDLDELITFEKKEVIVYKDDETKHELGKGLNKPAIVELLGVFPPRQSTSAEKYKERVKQRTESLGATFLDYSIEKGIWRFRVEHFSRYAFVDNDNDDDNDDVDMDSHKIQTGADDHEPHIEPLSQKTSMSRSIGCSRGRMSFSADRSGLLRQSGLFSSDAHCNSVVSSLRECHPPLVVGDKCDVVDNTMLSITSGAEVQTDGNVAGEVMASKKAQFPTSEVFPVVPISLKPLGVGKSANSTAYHMMLKASDSVDANAVRNYIDGCMFMARTFRCSWGPNGELVHPGKLFTRTENCCSSEHHDRRVSIEFPLRLAENRKMDLHEGIKLHYEYTSQDRNSKGVLDQDDSDVSIPYALPIHDQLMNCMRKYVVHAEARFSKNPTGSFEKVYLLVWKLVQALWGQEHDVTNEDRQGTGCYPLLSRNDSNEVETMESFQSIDLRREAISRWFEAALNDVANEGISDGSPSSEGILRLLCQHRIVEAAEMAVDCGDLRLATLIAQAASYEHTTFRGLMETQMAHWKDNESLKLMDQTVILIYSVLSGTVEVVSAKKGSQMSWIACLALFLWYKRGPAMSLKSAVAHYEDTVRKEMASPCHSQFAAARSDKDDVLMELMKLYIGDVVSLCQVLSPSGFMPREFYHLDYELSWHLYSVLQAIGYKLDGQWESHLHQNYIRQLEECGLWQDAVYVALNISDVTEREHTSLGLLFRNADALALDASIRSDLCDRLRVPPKWISEVLAVRAITKQDRHTEITHWMAAGRYEEAHACLISHVAMHCLFAGKKEVLLRFLLELEPMSVYISRWKSCDKVDSIGGGLLLEYLRLEQQNELEVGHEDQFVQRIMLLSQQLSSARDASTVDISNKHEGALQLAFTCVSSLIMSLATQAVQLRSLCSYTQERAVSNDSSSVSLPLELEPEFLSSLSHFATGRESSFVESYRTSQLMHLCTTFIDWRAQ
ncbi:hypothetical protein PsorP6_001331 [Peronosclerospora sorghi]|uniref:Uncharacterized protein n=1 Tax=Peronosclerospora sorghi TaxID=230839 RepID=A0ACC0WXJ2_9STRA|nr:hypothetical protein PsorP6_001331 [Peronosclerospora sorghi]